MYEFAEYRLCGDSAISVEFGNKIDEKSSMKVQALMSAIDKENLKGIKECVSCYSSLFVSYDPLLISYDYLKGSLKELENRMEITYSTTSLIIEIPVLYGGDYGPDLENIAKYNSLPEEEVKRLHYSRIYPIHMLGFTPGFPYLGEVDPRIAVPRLENPRVKIPAGSVGIAGRQTGIYSMDSPGGWQLLGRTPVTIFDPSNSDPFLLKPGMYIRFIEIAEKEYHEIKQLTETKSYNCKTYFEKVGGF